MIIFCLLSVFILSVLILFTKWELKKLVFALCILWIALQGSFLSIINKKNKKILKLQPPYSPSPWHHHLAKIAAFFDSPKDVKSVDEAMWFSSHKIVWKKNGCGMQNMCLRANRPTDQPNKIFSFSPWREREISLHSILNLIKAGWNTSKRTAPHSC